MGDVRTNGKRRVRNWGGLSATGVLHGRIIIQMQLPEGHQGRPKTVSFQVTTLPYSKVGHSGYREIPLIASCRPCPMRWFSIARWKSWVWRPLLLNQYNPADRPVVVPIMGFVEMCHGEIAFQKQQQPEDTIFQVAERTEEMRPLLVCIPLLLRHCCVY